MLANQLVVLRASSATHNAAGLTQKQLSTTQPFAQYPSGGMGERTRNKVELVD